MKPVQTIAAVMLFALAAVAYAHTHLHLSVPADGDVLAQSPPRLVLEFTGAVRLVKVTVTIAQGEPVPLEVDPGGAPAKHFSIPLPALAPGVYTVDWVAMGKDTHKVSGNFSFTLQDAGSIKAMNTQ